jgi:hypothetical protein
MTIFYWVMGVLTVGTFLPSVFFLLLYAFTGEDGCARRASALFSWAKLFGLVGFNIGIWGHVVVALWRMAFR